VDCCVNFHCPERGCLCLKAYFAETPKWTITNFCICMKKLESLAYFSLADCMVLSSAIRMAHFPFLHILGPKLPAGFRRWGTNLQQISAHDSPIICAKQVYFGVLRNCTIFETGIDKNGSKWLKISIIDLL